MVLSWTVPREEAMSAQYASEPPPVVAWAISSGQQFLQNYGWHVLFFLFIWYMKRDDVYEYLEAREKKSQLRAARAGDRVAVHEANARAVRERQQKKVEADAAEYRKRKNEEKRAKALEAAKKAAEGGSSGGGGRPLDGNRGGGQKIIHRIQQPSNSTRRS